MWKGGKIGILLLHGLTATPAEVREFAEKLHQKGYTLSGPLLPGHGTYSEALNRVRWQDWVETAVAAYHHLETVCERVFVGGESTGAVIALYLASQIPDIAGILAYSPAIKLNMSKLDVLKLYLAAPFLKSIPKEAIDVSEKWQGYPDNPLRGAIELLRLERATLRRLPLVRQPILVVQGAHDTTIHPDSGKIILENSRASHKAFHIMAHSSHVVLLDRELESITELTLAFLRQMKE